MPENLAREIVNKISLECAIHMSRTEYEPIEEGSLKDHLGHVLLNKSTCPVNAKRVRINKKRM